MVDIQIRKLKHEKVAKQSKLSMGLERREVGRI